MIGLRHVKLGERDFLKFKDGMVPVDQVKAIRRVGDSIQVAPLDDTYSERGFEPLTLDKPAEQ